MNINETTAANIEIPPLVLEMATAVSTQVRAANRTWLAMIVLVLFAIIPRAVSAEVDLPMSLGKVDAENFFIIMYILISVLYIAFAIAHAQSIRSALLAQNVIEVARKHWELRSVVDLKDVFDSLRVPAISRTAPLAQILRGKYQFYSDKHNCPKYLIFASLVHHVFFKFITIVIYILLPAYALYFARTNVALGGGLEKTFGALLNFIYLVDAAVVIVFGQLLWNEFKYLVRAVRAML